MRPSDKRLLLVALKFWGMVGAVSLLMLLVLIALLDGVL